MPAPDPLQRTRVLYLAPWVDYGGSDKGTIDWFRWLDRSRHALWLATTQPSSNRLLAEIEPYAEEIWPLPDLMAGQHMPQFLFDMIATRGIDVLHIMNSRLAYELLPDLNALPRPPKVVVQLHVEEQDRSGYVRLITRRYGNLVDAFSVTSHHLAQAVEGYDVARSKIHVIPTGVDAENEFSPDRVRAVEGLEDGALHVLYPGRLVEQKDPLLFCEVAARAVALEPSLRFHVVGEGPLEPDVRRIVAERGLEENVRFHAATNQLASWFAACDVLLMTSVFEGVPYVAYEAMAMGLPVVAPALPGNVELLGESSGALIEPRDDAEAYAQALAGLAADTEQRAAIGERSRARALGELSVRAMAESHERLYARLLGGPDRDGERQPVRIGPLPAIPESARLPARPRGEQPLVSIVLPCFNDGRYLPDCLASLRTQTWPNLEILVVDDASTDPGTIEFLAELEQAADVTVLRMEVNGGPSRARNAALERVTGRYVLPVDADNMLLPDAVERLVAQLSEAGEDVGFIYPNVQYFGGRRDYFEAPEYNLAALLVGNTCDTCSLFDGELIARGLRFADDIRLGHEDWDLVLQLAEQGVRGEAARYPTLLYRKSGFTRSDTVEYAADLFHLEAESRHPALFGESATNGRWGRYNGPAAAIKARWSPGLSLIGLTPSEPLSEAGWQLRMRTLAQTCKDFELVLRSEADWPKGPSEPSVRRIPAALASSPADALESALRVARAPFALVTTSSGSQLLGDPGMVEKLLRSLDVRPGLQAIVLVDAGEAGRYALRRLGPDEAPGAHPHSILLRRDLQAPDWPPEVEVDIDAPIASLAARLSTERVEWRHHAMAGDVPRASGRRTSLRLAPPLPRNGNELRERADRLTRHPAIPALPANHVRRWTLSHSWLPPETLPLVRHRRLGGDERIVTNDRAPAPGYAIEFDLGVVNRFQPAGTAELRAHAEEGFVAIPDEDEGAPLMREPRHPDCLGFVEEAAFPLLDPLEVGFHPPSGQWVLVCGAGDPLSGEVENRRTLGFVEAFPNHPRLAPLVGHPYGLRPLIRTVDDASRRHRYGVETAPAGEISLELGALHTEPSPDSVPLRLADDSVVVEEPAPAASEPGVKTSARWALAPLTWRGAGPRARGARSTSRATRLPTGTARPRPTSPPATCGRPTGRSAGRSTSRCTR